jgi:hypothetical protein
MHDSIYMGGFTARQARVFARTMVKKFGILGVSFGQN